MIRISRYILSTIIPACVSVLIACSVQDAGNSQDVSSGGKKVCGTIYDTGGRFVADARVVLRPRDYLSGFGCLAKVSARIAGVVCSTTTDSCGRFFFTDEDLITPALYSLEATSFDGTLSLFIDSVLLDSAFLNSFTWLAIDTPEYSTTLLPVGGIHGVVSLPGGGMVQGMVQIYGLDRSVKVHDDGTYTFEMLPPGNLRLRFAVSTGDPVLNGVLVVKTISGVEVPAAPVTMVPVDLQTNGKPPSVSYWLAAVDTARLILPGSPGEIRPGYRFNGWNTEADGSGTSYSPGDTIGSFDGIDGLFAQWTLRSEMNAKTSIVSTVNRYSYPIISDDAIYYVSLTDTINGTSASKQVLVRVDKASGSTQMFVFDYFMDYRSFCESGEYLYFQDSRILVNGTVYRFPKSFKGVPEQIADFSTDPRLCGVSGNNLILSVYRPDSWIMDVFCYTLPGGNRDTVIAGAEANWFDCDDRALYWTVPDDGNTRQSRLFRREVTTGVVKELYTGRFYVDRMDSVNIYIFDQSDDTVDYQTTVAAERLMKVDKISGGKPAFLLKEDYYFHEDDAYVVVGDILYSTNLRGELWKIPLGNPAGGAVLIDKWGPYDDDDFWPQLIRDGDDLYWIAGPDPDVRISDDDWGVLLRTGL